MELGKAWRIVNLLPNYEWIRYHPQKILPYMKLQILDNHRIVELIQIEVFKTEYANLCQTKSDESGEYNK